MIALIMDAIILYDISSKKPLTGFEHYHSIKPSMKKKAKYIRYLRLSFSPVFDMLGLDKLYFFVEI